MRRSAQYTRPSLPSQPSTPKKLHKRGKRDTRKERGPGVEVLEVMDTERMKANVYDTKAARVSIDAHGAVHVFLKHDSSQLLICPGVYRCLSERMHVYIFVVRKSQREREYLHVSNE